MDLSRTEIKTIRNSGLVACVVFAIIATLHLFKGRIRFSSAAYIISSFFFITALFMPGVLKRITQTVSWAIRGLLLTVVFYLAITPIGLFMRMLGKCPLDKNIDKKKDSYWIKKEAYMKNYEKQF